MSDALYLALLVYGVRLGAPACTVTPLVWEHAHLGISRPLPSWVSKMACKMAPTDHRLREVVDCYHCFTEQEARISNARLSANGGAGADESDEDGMDDVMDGDSMEYHTSF